MPNSFSRAIVRFAVPLALLSGYGCRCGAPAVNRSLPDVAVDAEAISFATCPQQDESGLPVPDVFPDQKILNLTNSGRANAVMTARFEGPEKDEFSLVDLPTTLGPTARAAVAIRYAPKHSGESNATLTLDDGTDDTEPLTVTLQGEGRNLPATPTLKVSYQSHEDSTELTDCGEGQSCTLNYPVTSYDQSKTLKVRLQSAGCPALKINGIRIDEHQSTPGRIDYAVTSPSVAPTVSAPVLLTSTDSNNQLEVEVRFTPTRSEAGDDLRYALLTVSTNDPVTPELKLTLAAQASQPAIDVSPTFCDFSEPSDGCNTTQDPNKARLVLTNLASSPVTIDTVLLEKPGSRFSIVNSPEGETLDVGGARVVEVTYTDGVTLVQNRLVFTASAGGNAKSDAVVQLRGGVPPGLETEPQRHLDFSDATTAVATKTVTIRNLPGKGDLIIDKVSVTGRAAFQLLTAVNPGTTVVAGDSLPLVIQFTKSPLGGDERGELRIETNDPAHPATGKLVTLSARTPVNPAPTAVLKGCLVTDTACANGKQQTFIVAISDLLGTPKQVLIWGKDSFDEVVGGSPNPVNSYEFRLVATPMKADPTVVHLENDRVFTPDGSALLTVDPAVTGVYTLSMLVKDEEQQLSSNVLLRVVVQ